MKYANDTGVTITVNPTDSTLAIYQACRAARLLLNETFSALRITVDEEHIMIDRKRNGAPILTLDAVC